MKALWILPCLLFCSCANAQQSAPDYYQSVPQTVNYSDQYVASTAPVSNAAYATTSNPYALEAPAYEKQENIALKQKEEELFQKERFLLESQQELYEREKKLADREAAFINRSKALDYKERNIMEGRYYAPVSVPAPTPVYYMPAPVPAPMPAPAPTVVAQPVSVQSTYVEETVQFNAASQPAAYEPVDTGCIIMQHPIQRDLVRCPVTDDVCLQSYERLGYVRSNNLSGYATQDEASAAPKKAQPSNTAGQWRENSSVPRW